MACRACGGPVSRIFDHAARSALSQSIACFRQRVLAASSSGGSSLPSPRSGQCRGAGGVVAVLDLHVVGQLRLGLEGLGPESGRGGVEFFVVTELGEAALGSGEHFNRNVRKGS